LGSLFKLRQRTSQLQKTADEIELQFRAVELAVGNYKGLTHVDALQLFVENVETIRSEHMTRQRQLDQPSDLRYIDHSSMITDRPIQQG
jgi:hypothetical protein